MANAIVDRILYIKKMTTPVTPLCKQITLVVHWDFIQSFTCNRSRLNGHHAHLTWILLSTWDQLGWAVHMQLQAQTTLTDLMRFLVPQNRTMQYTA